MIMFSSPFHQAPDGAPRVGLFSSALVLILAFALVFSLTAPAALAQQEIFVGEGGDQGVAPEGEDSAAPRPAMRQLFFNGEQRRILEGVRQGIVPEINLEESDSGDLTTAFFEVAPIDEAEEVGRPRGEVQFGGLIRNNSKGSATFYYNNGQEAIIDAENSELAPEFFFSAQGRGRSDLAGIDSGTGRRFHLKIGQILNSDGQIEETYPVIKRAKKGAQN